MSELLNDIGAFVDSNNRMAKMKTVNSERSFNNEQIPAIVNFLVAAQMHQSSDMLCRKLIPDWDIIKRDYQFDFGLVAKPKFKDAEVVTPEETNDKE